MDTDELTQKFWERIVQQKELKKELSNRKNAYLLQSIQPELLEKYKTDGWETEKQFKQEFVSRKPNR